MRQFFFDKLSIDIEEMNKKLSQRHKKPDMVLIRRSAGAKHTRNSHDLVRQWSDEFTMEIIDMLKISFPQYNVVIFNDKNETLMNSQENQVLIFSINY